jgi:Fur family peroxide stress response transcriptional regulator
VKETGGCRSPAYHGRIEESNSVERFTLMTDPKTRYEQLISRLRELEYRLTPQRMALVRLIAASDGHPSASQLYERVKTEYPTMSQATVYKTLDMLKELDEVVEIDLRDDSHYDGNKPFAHPHLICLGCRKIIDGEVGLEKSLVERLEKASGYQIVRHQLNLFGYCPQCRKKQ